MHKIYKILQQQKIVGLTRLSICSYICSIFPSLQIQCSCISNLTNEWVGRVRIRQLCCSQLSILGWKFTACVNPGETFTVLLLLLFAEWSILYVVIVCFIIIVGAIVGVWGTICCCRSKRWVLGGIDAILCASCDKICFVYIFTLVSVSVIVCALSL